MSIAIIAGISQSLNSRFKSLIDSKACSYRNGWSVRIVEPVQKTGLQDFSINIKAIERLVRDLSNDYDGPHFLAYKSSEDNQRRWLKERIVPYFRFRWLENATIRGQEKKDLIDSFNHINDVLLGEEEWSRHVKPQSTKSPLLLPEKSFLCHRQVQNMWEQARGADLTRILSFYKLFEEFDKYHLGRSSDHKNIWIDRKNNAFNWHGETHGIAPPPRCWKYSYFIPPGFHYDVTSQKSQYITMECATGDSICGTYLNVDPHGYIRA